MIVLAPKEEVFFAAGACDAGRGGAAGACDAGRGAEGATLAEGGALPVARRTSYRRRDVGSTARHPSSSSSIEKPLIGADSPRWARALCSAFCQESDSTVSDSFSLLPSDVISTTQRIRRFAFRAGAEHGPTSHETLTRAPSGRSTRERVGYSGIIRLAIRRRAGVEPPKRLER